jgi:WD40 repeat protein
MGISDVPFDSSQLPQGEILSLAFHPNGRWLAGACLDKRVALWDFRAQPSQPTPPARLLTGHRDEVWSVGFSPDGRYLASGSGQGVIILWDGATFQRIVTLRGDTRQIRGIAFSHDSRLLAGAAYAAPTVVWDLPALRHRLGAMKLDW